MPVIHELRGIQRDLLFIIGGLAEPNGQEIRAEMERSLTADVQQGRIYSNLDDLVEDGFVEKGRQNGRTNCYTLTERGRAVIESRHEWERRYLDAPESS